MYYAVQLVGVRGSGGVRGGLHLLRQVSGAVQGVCGSPVEKSLFSVEEEQLQGQVRTGSLHGRQKRRGSSHSFEMTVTERWFIFKFKYDYFKDDILFLLCQLSAVKLNECRPP